MNRLLDERPTILTGQSAGIVVLNQCVVEREACIDPTAFLNRAVSGEGPYALVAGAQTPELGVEPTYCMPELGQEYCYSNVVGICVHLLASVLSTNALDTTRCLGT